MTERLIESGGISIPYESEAVLLGLGIPAILRQSDDGSWMFVGTAYVPGFMGGEAAEQMDSSTVQRLALR